MGIAIDELDRLLEDAKRVGCEAALYELARKRIAEEKTLLEDPRVADWIYLTPLARNAKALVIGCGLGTLPLSLARVCKEVTVVDPDSRRIGFLNLRMKEKGIRNVETICGTPDESLEESFDLVSLTDWSLVGKMPPLLKEGGVLGLSVGNRLWGRGDHTLSGYRRRLRKIGFSDLLIHAPLPYHDGIPLFYLPLGRRGAMNFFFEKIFPLAEMVSPETKKQYAIPYQLARIGVRIAKAFHLLPLAGNFVPGFLVLAKKGGAAQE